MFLQLAKLFFCIALFCGGLLSADAAAREKSVWLVSNGFHTSLAIRAHDFPQAETLSGDPKPDFFLVGWGAADFYRGRKDFWTICRSTLWPTASALHVVPIRGPVARRFNRSDVIHFTLPNARYRELLATLAASFFRDARGHLVLLGPGSFPQSRFYAGREYFCLLRMCNTWVTQKLRRSGIPLCPLTAIPAGGLTFQVAKLGKREQRRRKPLDAF